MAVVLGQCTAIYDFFASLPCIVSLELQGCDRLVDEFVQALSLPYPVPARGLPSWLCPKLRRFVTTEPYREDVLVDMVKNRTRAAVESEVVGARGAGIVRIRELFVEGVLSKERYLTLQVILGQEGKLHLLPWQ